MMPVRAPGWEHGGTGCRRAAAASCGRGGGLAPPPAPGISAVPAPRAPLPGALPGVGRALCCDLGRLARGDSQGRRPIPRLRHSGAWLRSDPLRRLRRGLLEAEPAQGMLQWPHSGFQVHTGVGRIGIQRQRQRHVVDGRNVRRRAPATGPGRRHGALSTGLVSFGQAHCLLGDGRWTP